MTLRAGFIGLGNIGKPLASHLAPAGFETTLYDIDEAPLRELSESGAKAARTPREVGENAEVIGICVPEDDHVRAVLRGEDGVFAGAAPGAVIAIHSTILPQTAIDLDAEAPEGVTVIDACVTGGDQRAAEGVVTYLVGGPEDAVAKVRPFLEPSSEHVIHAGPLGAGAKLKLAVNVLTYLQWAAAYESYHLARAAGLDPDLFVEAVKSNGQLTELQSRYLVGVGMPPEVRRSEGVQKLMRGHTAIAEKDLKWALALAHESKLKMPVTGLVSQMMGTLYGVEDEEPS